MIRRSADNAIRKTTTIALRKRNHLVVVLRMASDALACHVVCVVLGAAAGLIRLTPSPVGCLLRACGHLSKDGKCPVKYGRVLLADSHLNLLRGVHSLLETVFDSVLMASDEHSLMEAIELLHPDLVVVDLSLPGPSKGTGMNLVTRLKGDFPRLPLIVLSVHDDPIVADEIRSAGAAGFVLKRSAAMELIPAVHEVLAGGVYVSPSV